MIIDNLKIIQQFFNEISSLFNFMLFVINWQKNIITYLISCDIFHETSFMFDKILFWSDSTIILDWFNSVSHALKIFILHYIANIQSI